MPSTKLCSPRNELIGNERRLYPCLFRGRQACTSAVNKYLYNINTQHKNKLLNLHFTFKHVIWAFWLNFTSFQKLLIFPNLWPNISLTFLMGNRQDLVKSTPLIHTPMRNEPEPGPKSRVLDWLRHSEVKVFVSLCFYSTAQVCARFGTDRPT